MADPFFACYSGATGFLWLRLASRQKKPVGPFSDFLNLLTTVDGFGFHVATRGVPGLDLSRLLPSQPTAGTYAECGMLVLKFGRCEFLSH
jgi:hypothetical protein